MFTQARIREIPRGATKLEQAIPGDETTAFWVDSREWFKCPPKIRDYAGQRVAMLGEFAQEGSRDTWEVHCQD
jgi:hypothetical protein